LIPAIEVAVACYAVGVALSLVVEVIVFFSRVGDPHARVERLERALVKTRARAESIPPPTTRA